MKTLFIIILLFVCVQLHAQGSVKTDSTDLKNLTARYQKIQKQYFDLKDELMRYEGRLQMLEVLIREEEIRIKNAEFRIQN